LASGLRQNKEKKRTKSAIAQAAVSWVGCELLDIYITNSCHFNAHTWSVLSIWADYYYIIIHNVVCDDIVGLPRFTAPTTMCAVFLIPKNI
jgi:hypothetical protein